MNKKENKTNNIAMFFFGFAIGLVSLMMFFSEFDEWMPYLVSGILLAGGAAIFLVVFLLNNFLLPYLNRRKAAMRALGKEGIRIVRKDNTAKLAYKGIYALLDGKFAKSEDLLQQALAHSDVRQNQMFCTEWLIRLYDAMENMPKLLWCYRKAVEFEPDNPEAQSRLGQVYLNKGELDKAIYCFEQAIRYDPNNGFSYYSLSIIYMIRGQDEKAFELLKQLVKINEEHPLCHSQLANYYALKGDREMAETECKKAQLCGIKDPDEINRRINAMLDFHDGKYSGDDLPTAYYRKVEKAGDTKKSEMGEVSEIPKGEGAE